MSALINLVALPLQLCRRQPSRKSPLDPRILVIRRNRMGDMIYTLPLLHALRRHFPQAHLTVACDPPGAAIAQACDAVNEVIVLERSWIPWLTTIKNAARLQNFDWVVAAKGGFDRRLSTLTRLTNAGIRIGFAQRMDRPSAFYTDPVALPENPFDEHQIETLLRLLRPLGVVTINNFAINLSLTVPEASRQFANLLTPLGLGRLMLINLSSTVKLKFREQDFIELISQILASTDLTIGLVAAPADQPRATELATQMTSERVIAMATPGPLDLAALLQKAVCLFTPEGGAAHLAASVGTSAVVLWSEGPFKKWHSRGTNHVFVHAEKGESSIPLERVWQALQPLLPQKK